MSDNSSAVRAFANDEFYLRASIKKEGRGAAKLLPRVKTQPLLGQESTGIKTARGGQRRRESGTIGNPHRS